MTRELLDQVDQAIRRAHPGRAPLTEVQRRIILAGFAHATPFSASRRLRLVRLLRTSPAWARLRAARQRATP